MAERILGIDYGEARVGIALSDGLGLTANPLPYVPGGGRKRVAFAVRELCREHGVSRIVIGLPRHLDGGEGATADKVRAFGELLSSLAELPVEYLDERLTSKAVDRLMIAADISRAKRREKIDSLAASVILQNYLDAQRNAPPPADPAAPA